MTRDADADFVQRARELAGHRGGTINDYLIRGHKAVAAMHWRLLKKLNAPPPPHVYKHTSDVLLKQRLSEAKKAAKKLDVPDPVQALEYLKELRVEVEQMISDCCNDLNIRDE